MAERITDADVRAVLVQHAPGRRHWCSGHWYAPKRRPCLPYRLAREVQRRGGWSDFWRRASRRWAEHSQRQRERAELAERGEPSRQASEALKVALSTLDRVVAARAELLDPKAFLTEGPMVGRLKVEAMLTKALAVPAPADEDVRADMLDYPTAWAIQRRGLVHASPRCSAVQTGGAMLCDCGAVRRRWEQIRRGEESP